ncbi:MAG: hypothetical protein GKR90_25130 [Pseudomonadales bacterium]|nr:hypothetical protein [Pseudomonadales bacterium]
MSEIDDFLGQFEVTGNVAQALREFVKETAPGCSETLHLGWKVISYGDKKKFCAIAPHAKWVNLQFHNGASLTDPEGRMGGTGKSIRHMKVASSDELDDYLSTLIKEAISAST